MDSVIECMVFNSVSRPKETAFTFIEDDGRVKQISFAELHDTCINFAGNLLKKIRPGEPALLLLPHGIEYLQAFLGCLYAGVIAVPLYPPLSLQHAGRALKVIDNSGASIAIVGDGMAEKISAHLPTIGMVTIGEMAAANMTGDVSLPKSTEIAFLQYTSGSTGSPKGVIVSHGNIVSNSNVITRALSCTSGDVFCNWLPLFHDMGLISTLMLPIFLGSHSVLMSPARFTRRPKAWLRAITEYRGTFCSSPNFGFDYCVSRVSAAHSADLDLSSWRVACNGAEPVSAATMKRFSQAFAHTGFRESTFYPCYGMAEATLCISGGIPAAGPIVTCFDKLALQQGEALIAEDVSIGQVVVGCGKAQLDHDIRIVNPDSGQELQNQQIGEIWFSGPSVTLGYWKDEEKTGQSFFAKLPHVDRKYLRTGDLGFFYNEELYITGRSKDLLIIKGRNYFPQDIESLIYETQSGLVRGGCVVFEVNGRIVIVQEVLRKEQNSVNFEFACKNIQGAIYGCFELFIEDVLFIPAKGLSTTSSGKLQRGLTKQRYLENKIDFLFSLKLGSSSPQLETSADFVEVEIFLVTFCREELEAQNCEVQSNLFDFGVHSLFVMKLIAVIQETWSVEMSVHDVFNNQTIRDLAKFILSTGHKKPAAHIPPIRGSQVKNSLKQRPPLGNEIELEV